MLPPEDHFEKEAVGSAPLERTTAADLDKSPLATTREAVRDRLTGILPRISLELIIDRLSDGLVIIDEQGKFIHCNREAFRILGLNNTDTPPDQWPKNSGVFHPESLKPFEDEDNPLTQAFNGKSVTNREVFVRNLGVPNGAFISVTATPLTDKSGAFQGVVAVFHDITAQKTEVADLSAAKRATEEQLRQMQKIDGIGRLAGGIAHDFNNLLTAITGYSELSLELLQRSQENAPKIPQAEALTTFIEAISAAGKRAAILTQQLLIFSRRQINQPKNFDLHQVIESMMKYLPRLIGEDFRITIKRGALFASLHADPMQIEQLILNLLVNARDAMPEGGNIVIETKEVSLTAEQCQSSPEVRPGEFIRLSIKDEGCGMPEEVLKRLFEPFFTTKEAGKGTGLGLSVCYGIAKNHGGWISVHSEVGKGSLFEVFLPACPGENKLSDTAEIRLENFRGHEETVLVVEDDASVAAFLQAVLESNGYKVMLAGNGRDAQEIFTTHPDIDLVMSDVVLPDVKGPQLMSTLQSIRPTPMILSSGYTDSKSAREFIGTSKIPFLSKPFTPGQLLQKFREMLAKK